VSVEWKRTAPDIYRIGNSTHDQVFVTLFVDGFLKAHPDKVECRVYERQPGGTLAHHSYICDNLTEALKVAEKEITRRRYASRAVSVGSR